MSRTNRFANLIATIALMACGVFWLAKPDPVSAQCVDNPTKSSWYTCHQVAYPEFGQGEWHDSHYQARAERFGMTLGFVPLAAELPTQPPPSPGPNDQNQIVIPPSSEVDGKPVIMWYPELFWLPLLLLILLSYVLLFRHRSHNFNA